MENNPVQLHLLTQSALTQILELKLKGNNQYTTGKIPLAIATYTQALSLFNPDASQSSSIFSYFQNRQEPLLPTSHTHLYTILLSNRSACYAHIRNYHDALVDANMVIEFRPDWHKGHLRKATCEIHNQQYTQALSSLHTSLSHCTNPKDIAVVQDRIGRTKVYIEDQEMGVRIEHLSPGKEFAIKSVWTPVQNFVFDYAVQMKNFVHLVGGDRKCFVIDACWDIDGIIKYATSRNLEIVGAILTHYHIDHAGGIPPPPFNTYKIQVEGILKLLRKLPNIKCYINPLDIPGLVESNPGTDLSRFIQTTDGMCVTLSANSDTGSGSSSLSTLKKKKSFFRKSTSTLSARSLNLDLERTSSGKDVVFKFIHTPGHTPGSQCVLVNDKRLFSGDTLFIGGAGRTDFKDSCVEDLQSSLKRMSKFDDDVIVFPGHSYGGSWTSVGKEKAQGLLMSSL